MVKQGNKQPKQVVDFNKLRKKRQISILARRLLALAGVAALAVGLVLLNKLFVQESITTRLSDVFGGIGGTGYPVTLPGGVIRDVKAVGDSLCVLNDTNLHVYSAGGKLTGSFQKMTEKTVLLASDNRLMTYGEGAKKYAIHSRGKTVHEQETEYALITATINGRGDYAVVSSSKQSICEINVFNKHFESVYQCYFASNVVSAVSLSPNGMEMAAGWVNAKDGVLYSGVDLYSLSSSEVQATLELPEDLVLEVQYLEEDRIGVLTDRQYFIMGADGKVKYTYSFSGRTLAAIERQGRQTLLLFDNREAGVGDLVLLGANLEEKAVLASEEKVLDVALGARRIYVLNEGAIRVYSQKFEPNKEEAVSSVDRIELAGDRLYYFDRGEIRVLGQKEASSAASQEREEAFAEFEASEGAGGADAVSGGENSAGWENSSLAAESSASSGRENSRLIAETAQTSADSSGEESA